MCVVIYMQELKIYIYIQIISKRLIYLLIVVKIEKNNEWIRMTNSSKRPLFDRYMDR